MLETHREDLEGKNHAAGIGHELRNSLSVIESSVFLLRQRLTREGGPIDPDVLRHLDKIAGEVRRSASTINDLLDLAGSAPLKRRPSRARSDRRRPTG